jgi:hypothetical protein
MQLKTYQDHFKSTMLSHAPPPEGVFKMDDIPVIERMNVYRDNILGNLSDVIVQTFPLIKALVGEDFLRGMAREFIRKHPPSQGWLNLYGRGFDAFIAHFPPASSLPYLPDMARLEIAVNEAYFAPDDQPLSAQDLATIPPEDLEDTRLQPRSSVYLVRSSFPLMDIRDLCLNPDQDKTLDLDAGGVYLMIHRPALKVQFTSLSKSEYEWLTALENQTLGEAVEHVIAQNPDFDLQNILQKHMYLETFSTF